MRPILNTETRQSKKNKELKNGLTKTTGSIGKWAAIRTQLIFVKNLKLGTFSPREILYLHLKEN